MRNGLRRQKDWLGSWRGAGRAEAVARAAGTPLLVVMLAMWPATWLMRLLGLIPADLINCAGVADSTAATCVTCYLLWRGHQLAHLRRIWREQRGRMADTGSGRSAGNVLDVSPSRDEALEYLYARRDELRAERVAQAAEADPAIMQRLETAEQELAALKNGLRSALAAVGEESAEVCEIQRPELRVIRGGVAS